jgi:hypothetical protein
MLNIYLNEKCFVFASEVYKSDYLEVGTLIAAMTLLNRQLPCLQPQA